MMQFKTLKHAGIAALATTLFTACSDENHAGVLTETESGTTIASIVKDENGNPVTSAKVSLISTTHVAARMAPIKTTMTDEEGRYTLDSISAGEYALQISNTEHTQSAYLTLSIEDNKSSLQALSIPEAKLEKNASLELGLSSYELNSGDTLCITGTLNCAAIENSDVKAGIVTIREIPPFEFTKITLIRGAGRDTSTREVKWDFVPGETLEIMTNIIPVTITDDVMNATRKLNGKQTLDSLIVPVTLTSKLVNPILINEKGDTLALFKVENDKDENRYLAVMPIVNTGTHNYTVASSDSLLLPPQISKAYAITEPNMVVQENSYSQTINSYSNSFGISFWIEALGSTIKNVDSIFLKSVDNDVIYRLRTGDTPEQLCANFYKRDSTDSGYQITYYTISNSYCHNVLDGKRHHYTIFVKANRVVIAIDGEIAEDVFIKNAFINFPGFTVGNHTLKDLTTFSLSPNTIEQLGDEGWERLYAWLYAYYMVQK